MCWLTVALVCPDPSPSPWLPSCVCPQGRAGAVGADAGRQTEVEPAGRVGGAEPQQDRVQHELRAPA